MAIKDIYQQAESMCEACLNLFGPSYIDNGVGQARFHQMLASEQLVAIGYSSLSDTAPSLIPGHHWHFLTPDFDESKASGEHLRYVGIKVINASELSTADKDLLANRDEVNPSSAETQAQSAADPFVEYQKMENLSWDEVSISLVAGDLIQVSARGRTRHVSYERMGLVDKRIDKGILSRQGHTLLGIAQKKKSNDGQYQKHLSRLRGQLRSLFGIDKNPFRPSDFSNLHFPVFELNDFRDKSDQRAKKRAILKTVSYEDNKREHQMQGSLSDNLEDQQEEYSFDPDFGEGDEADDWLKNQ